MEFRRVLFRSLAELRLINDFEAVPHAISKLPAENPQLLFGEDRPFPENGAVTILGPGTGLGVAMIAYEDGVPHVVATEGGHMDFSPLDNVETRLLDYLRQKFVRVSVRSEEHTSELQSLMRISYAVFCLKKKNKIKNMTTPYAHK